MEKVTKMSILGKEWNAEKETNIEIEEKKEVEIENQIKENVGSENTITKCWQVT